MGFNTHPAQFGPAQACEHALNPVSIHQEERPLDLGFGVDLVHDPQDQTCRSYHCVASDC
jgi:hypothetical protein